MANVQPFRALRYDPARVGDWGTVLGPPYDIVDAAEAAALKAASEYQISHLETASNSDEITAAARLLADWRDSGVMLRDEQPSFYLHEQRIDGVGVRRTLFGAVELAEWGAGGVMPHERTMPGPKATRTQLRSRVGADISPLMAFAPDPDGALEALIGAAVALPVLCAGRGADGGDHSLRRISDPQPVADFQSVFARRNIYMADGHHRYESALASRDERPASNAVLMGLVSDRDQGLAVGATHRLLHRSTPPDFESRLADGFRVASVEPAQLAALEAGSSTLALLTLHGAAVLEPTESALMLMPDSAPEEWRQLPSAILEHAIIDPLLGEREQDLVAAGALSYTHDLSEAQTAVADGSAAAAFILPDPTLQDVIRIADAGSFMPQKSTYFTPKLPTGIVLRPLD